MNTLGFNEQLIQSYINKSDIYIKVEWKTSSTQSGVVNPYAILYVLACWDKLPMFLYGKCQVERSDIMVRMWSE